MTDIPDMDLADVIFLGRAQDVGCQERRPVRGLSRETRFEKCDHDADFQFVYDVDGQDGVQRVDYCWRHALPLPRDEYPDLPPVCGFGHGPMVDRGDEGTRWVCPDCGAVTQPGDQDEGQDGDADV